MIQLFFILSLLLSFFTTPYLVKISRFYNFLDEPSERKVHQDAIPRIGGVAIFFPFSLSLISMILFLDTKNAIYSNIIFFYIGAVVIFLIGLVDDIKGLSFRIKFFGQIAVSIFVYLFGFKITVVSNLFGHPIQLGILSLPVTIFWFVLIINSINLIDGLDGLAAGITLFASISMIFIHITNDHFFHAAIFASLAGALIGFLRYNFNPASIFMGDSGSYFLGYCLAALSINTSKGQMATALLSPMIILGIPILDTLWAPIRRFVAGQGMFQPDKGHIHHRLMQLGYTHRRAVIILYIITSIFGICGFILVHTQNETSALILFFLSVIGVVIARYLKISDLITIRKVSSWAGNFTKNINISTEYRIFLNQQFEISRVRNKDELWNEIKKSLSVLEIDYAELQYSKNGYHASKDGNIFVFGDKKNIYTRKFSIEFPLIGRNNGKIYNFGTIVIMKDMKDMKEKYYQKKLLKTIGILIDNTILALIKIQK